MKNNRKGFTVVELVIIIAVVAVLAAVLIPTFSAIVKRANISADTQAVRNMNIILASESAASPAPEYAVMARELLKANGINDFTPQTKFHSYFWIKDQNVIILADEGDRIIYPEEYRGEKLAPSWHNLEMLGSVELPQRPEGEETRPPKTFTLTVTQSGSSLIIPFENIPTVVNGYESFSLEISIPEALREDELHRLKKVTAIMKEGETEHKIEIRSKRAQETGGESVFEVDETALIEIPYVTGNIEINIDVAEYYIVNVRGDENTNAQHMTCYEFREDTFMIFSLSGSLLDDFILKPGYKVKSAKAYRNGEYLGDYYNAAKDYIRRDFTSISEMIEFDLYIETEERFYTVDMTIRESAGVLHQETVVVKYNAEKDQYTFTVDFNTFAEWGMTVRDILNNSYELEDVRYKPKFEYDPTTNTITVSNIKCDFKWICHVKR